MSIKEPSTHLVSINILKTSIRTLEERAPQHHKQPEDPLTEQPLWIRSLYSQQQLFFLFLVSYSFFPLKSLRSILKNKTTKLDSTFLDYISSLLLKERLLENRCLFDELIYISWKISVSVWQTHKTSWEILEENTDENLDGCFIAWLKVPYKIQITCYDKDVFLEFNLIKFLISKFRLKSLEQQN